MDARQRLKRKLKEKQEARLRGTQPPTTSSLVQDKLFEVAGDDPSLLALSTHFLKNGIPKALSCEAPARNDKQNPPADEDEEEGLPPRAL